MLNFALLPELPSDPRLLPQVLQADADVPARARGRQGQPAAGARPGHAPPRHVHRLTPPQALRLQRRGGLRGTQGKTSTLIQCISGISKSFFKEFDHYLQPVITAVRHFPKLKAVFYVIPDISSTASRPIIVLFSL